MTEEINRRHIWEMYKSQSREHGEWLGGCEQNNKMNHDQTDG